MLNKIAFTFTIIIFLFAQGCSSVSSLERKESKMKEVDNFNNRLGLNYLELARAKDEDGDGETAKYFAKKGKQAYRGRCMSPEHPEFWDIANQNMHEYKTNRNRLSLLMRIKRVKDERPTKLADILYAYDCWVANEGMTTWSDRTGNCRKQFLKKIDVLERQYRPKIAVRHVNLRKEYPFEQNEIVKVIDDVEFNVYFDFDSYKLNPKAMEEMTRLFDYLEKMDGDYYLVLKGSADRVGKRLYNDSLARKRVNVVRNKLVKNGVPKGAISIKSHGEKFPQIITRDNIKAQVNRVVSIYVRRSDDTISPLPLPLN
jgi:outer membrane protein OmpA-like peptidoglycan-associated protein